LYSETKEEEEKKPSMIEVLMTNVLKNPYIWGMALTYFFIYVIRQGVTSWCASNIPVLVPVLCTHTTEHAYLRQLHNSYTAKALLRPLFRATPVFAMGF
jgi:hypothetical protein